LSVINIAKKKGEKKQTPTIPAPYSRKPAALIISRGGEREK